MSPLDYSVERKTEWTRIKHIEIMKKLKPFIAKQKAGNMSKADYYRLVGVTVNLLGGRKKLQDAYDANTEARKKSGITDGEKTHYS